MATTDSGALRSYRDAEFPPAETPWREAAFSVIDLEMTGLDPASDEIISFATVTVSGGNVRLDDTRYELVRPRRMPDWDTIRIHGLREVDLEEAPPLEDHMDDLLDALTGRPIVAHVAEVERSFLETALSSVGIELRNPIVDTATLDSELRGSGGGSPPGSRSGFRDGALTRAARTPTAPRRRRRIDHSPGVHRARHPPRPLTRRPSDRSNGLASPRSGSESSAGCAGRGDDERSG